MAAPLDFLADVETAPDAMLVVSKYGFKKIILEGKTYLTAMTREEFEAFGAKLAPNAKPMEYGDGCYVVDHPYQQPVCRHGDGNCAGACVLKHDATTGFGCFCM